LSMLKFTQGLGYYPRFRQSILLLIFYIVLQLPVEIAFIVLDYLGIMSSVENNHAKMVVSTILTTMLILFIGTKKNRFSFFEAYPITTFQFSLLGPMSLTVLGVGILVSEVGNIIDYFYPMPQWFLDLFLLGGFWGVVFIVVVAPLTEEFLFRGLILRGFLSHYSVWKAIILSALLFGVIHLNPWQFPGAVFAGILFGWWFVKTGSLLPGIIGHALNNAVPFIALWLNLDIPGYTVSGSFQPIWFNLLGVVLLILGLVLTANIFQRHEQENPPDFC